MQCMILHHQHPYSRCSCQLWGRCPAAMWNVPKLPGVAAFPRPWPGTVIIAASSIINLTRPRPGTLRTGFQHVESPVGSSWHSPCSPRCFVFFRWQMILGKTGWSTWIPPLHIFFNPGVQSATLWQTTNWQTQSVSQWQHYAMLMVLYVFLRFQWFTGMLWWYSLQWSDLARSPLKGRPSFNSSFCRWLNPSVFPDNPIIIYSNINNWCIVWVGNLI